MKNNLILLVFLISLTACGDRVRFNCPPVKNKAFTAATESTIAVATTAPQYGSGGKCR